MSETYKPESPVPSSKPVAPYAHEGHEHSAVPYFVVWILLCILTGVTVLTGKQHWGQFALPLALFIATTKSLLVLIFFMHLKEQHGAPRLIIGLSVGFALLLTSFVMMDVTSRFGPLRPAQAPFGSKVHMPTEREKHEAANAIGVHHFPEVSP